MSEVKRYDIVPRDGKYDFHISDGGGRYVLAADYEALAAELAGYKEAHEKYCPSAKRVRELEAALRYIGKAYELAEDHTDVGITYQEALALKEPT